MKRTLVFALLLVVLVAGLVSCDYRRYTVSFYNGEVLVATQKIRKGNIVTFPESPTKDPDEEYEYIFKGWSTSPESTDTVKPMEVVEDISFYAVFTAQPKGSSEKKIYFTVTFVDGLTNETIGEQQVEAGADAVLPDVPDHTNEGYVFTEWSASNKNIRRTLTITAKYEKKNVTLTRHYLGKTREETLAVGSVISLDAPTIPQALEFGGWFYDEGLTQPASDRMPAENSDIYAKINVDFSSAKLMADGELKYGNNNVISVSGLAGNDILAYSYEWSDETTEPTTSFSTAGTHSLSVTITATYTADGEVVLTDKKTLSDSFEVAKAPLTATLKTDAATFVYGNVPTLSVEYTGFITGDNSDSVTPTYVYSKKSGDGYVAVPETERNKLGAGEYKVSANFDSQNYQVSNVNQVDFKIEPKPITITVEASNFTYGDDLDPEVLPKAIIPEDQLVYGDTADDFKAAINYTTQANQPYTPQGVFDVGSYYAKIESHVSSNYKVTTTPKAFTVEKRKVNITASATDITYGNTPVVSYKADKEILKRDEQTIGLVNKFKKNGSDFTLNAKYYPAGDYTFTIGYNASAASKNYEITVTEATFKVKKAQLTATFSLTSASLTYGQKPNPQLTFSGFVSGENESLIGEQGKTFAYKKGGQNHENNDKFEVGNYTVTAPTITLDNYNVTINSGNNGTLSFKVDKKTLTATVKLDNETITYGDKPSSSITYSEFAYGENSEAIGNPTVVYKNSSAVSSIIDDYSNGEKLSAGSYTATINGYSSDNYNVSVVTTTLTVNKKNLTVTVTATEDNKKNLTFGDKIDFKAQFSGFVNDENEDNVFGEQKKDIKVYNGNSSVVRNIASEVTLPAYGFYNVGSYTAKIEGLESANYNIKYSDFTFTVEKFNVTIAPTEANVKWSAGWDYQPEFTDINDGKFSNFTFETKIRLNTRDKGTYTANDEKSFEEQHFQWVDKDGLKVEESFEIIYDKDNVNIDVSKDFSVTYNITVTLNNSVFSVKTPENTNLTYDGASHKFDITVTPDEEVGQDVTPTIEYYVENGSSIKRVIDDYDTTAPQLTNAGNYTVNYRVSAQHYDELIGKFTVTINKAKNAITTKFEDSTFTYNAEDHNYDLTATATFGTVSVSTNGSGVVSLMATENELTVHNAGTYTVTFTVAGTSNYDEVTKTVTITVNKADYSVTANNQTYTYNGHTQGEGITVKGVGNDAAPKVEYSLGNTVLRTVALRSEEKLANAGTYTIEYEIDGGTNYNTVTGSFNVTIDPKKLTVSEENLSGTYGEAAIKFPDVEGLVGSEHAVTRTVQYQPNSGESYSDFQGDQTKDAGTYTVTYTVDGGNYYFEDNDNTETIIITIDKADGTLTRNGKELPTYTYEEGKEQTIDLSECYNKTGDGEISCINNKFTNVPESGNLTVTVVLSDTNNYYGDEKTATVTINKANYSGIADPTFDEIYMGFAPDGKPKTLSNVSLGDENWHWKEDSTVIHVGSNSANAIYYENSKRNNYNDLEKQFTFNAKKEKVYLVASNGEQDYDTTKTSVSTDMFGIRILNHNEMDLSDWQKYFDLSLSHQVNFALGGTYPVTINVSYKSEVNNITVTDYFELDKTSLEVVFKIKTVEYNGKLYTIEDALSIAESGTITIKYNTSFADKEIAKKIGYIVDDVPNDTYYTVKNGVILLLPYRDGETKAHETTRTIQFASTMPNLCHVNLDIVDSIILINRGHIIIGGITTGGNGGTLGAGQTASNYAQITMGNYAKIESYGDIDAFGFIKEKTENNGSEVNMKGGTLTEPFIVLEHRGGSVFLGMAGGFMAVFSGMKFKTAPFIRYYLENVSTNLTIEYAAKLNGHANLYAGDQDNETEIKLIGNDANCLIQLSEDSYIKAKYDTTTKITDLNTYGSWTLNSLSLSVKATITVEISMDKTFFPISYLYHITLNAIDNKAATVDATKQDLKFYPGAELTIGKNVTVNAKDWAIYDSTYIDPSEVNTNLNYPKNYPDCNKGAIGDAKITVNGVLEANTIGGKVIAGEDGAKVKAVKNSITVYELGTGSGTNVKYTNGTTLTFQGHTDDSETWSNLEANTTYTAKDNKWTKENA